MQNHLEDKKVRHEQDLSKKKKNELLDIVEKDFNRLWIMCEMEATIPSQLIQNRRGANEKQHD
jgi:hypothetical protein